jgi:hypothetical protein
VATGSGAYWGTVTSAATGPVEGDLFGFMGIQAVIEEMTVVDMEGYAYMFVPVEEIEAEVDYYAVWNEDKKTWYIKVSVPCELLDATTIKSISTVTEAGEDLPEPVVLTLDSDTVLWFGVAGADGLVDDKAEGKYAYKVVSQDDREYIFTFSYDPTLVRDIEIPMSENGQDVDDAVTELEAVEETEERVEEEAVEDETDETEEIVEEETEKIEETDEIEENEEREEIEETEETEEETKETEEETKETEEAVEGTEDFASEQNAEVLSTF